MQQHPDQAKLVREGGRGSGGGERRPFHGSDAASESKVWRRGWSASGLIELWFQVGICLCSGYVVSDDMIFNGTWCNAFSMEIAVVGAKPGLGT